MRPEFNRSFPFTMTGWRDAPATCLETGSYSDSEAPDAPERCRTNGLGTLRALSVRVAARTGETDILLWPFRRDVLLGFVVVLVLYCSTALGSGDIKKKCQKQTQSQYLPRAPSKTRYVWM